MKAWTIRSRSRIWNWIGYVRRKRGSITNILESGRKTRERAKVGDKISWRRTNYKKEDWSLRWDFSNCTRYRAFDVVLTLMLGCYAPYGAEKPKHSPYWSYPKPISQQEEMIRSNRTKLFRLCCLRLFFFARMTNGNWLIRVNRPVASVLPLCLTESSCFPYRFSFTQIKLSFSLRLGTRFQTEAQGNSDTSYSSVDSTQMLCCFVH